MRAMFAAWVPVIVAFVLSWAIPGTTAASPLSTELLGAAFIHMKYSFNLNLIYMNRSGEGEMWIDFDSGRPRHIKYQGRAHSPAFGEGDVVILVDVAERFVYAYFKLPDMEEKQCIRYDFPTKAERDEREAFLLWRERELEHAMEADEANPLRVQWTKKFKTLKLEEKEGRLKTIELLYNTTVRKTVHVEKMEVFPNGPVETDKSVFAKPTGECRGEHDVQRPIAVLEFVPPHHKSSALNDLLVAVANEQHIDHMFLLVSAFAVPGEVAVMIEKPEPPEVFNFGGVTFNYTATSHNPGAPDHMSNGSIWMNLDNREFRLRGEAAQTQGRGEFFLNLIAHGGGKDPGVYAHVNLPQEDQSQCVIYDYPELPTGQADSLLAAAGNALTFSKVDAIDGEDCAIYKTVLPRGRTLFLWMDLESDRPEAILRSEVWKGSTMLRRTDIHSWRVLGEADMELQPRDHWQCTESATSQLAYFNLRDVHKNSLELWDVLYSLQHLRSNFTVLEVLALTGDVAVMIEEPQFPDLEPLSDISFHFVAELKMLKHGIRPVQLRGSFLSSKEAQFLLAHVQMEGDTNISVAMALGDVEGSLSVKLAASTHSELVEFPSCLSVPLGGGGRDTVGFSAEQWQFMGMDIIGNTECNRYKSPSNRVGEVKTSSVELWYSPVDEKVLRLEVVPPDGDGASVVTMNIDHWQAGAALTTIEKQAEADADAVSKHWHCVDASQYPEPWLQLSTSESFPTNKVRSADVLSKLGEALGRTSMLPLLPSEALARLEIVSPSDNSALHPDQGPTHERPSLNERTVFDPEIAAISFEFTSTKRAGTGNDVAEQKGEGQLHVDFVNTRLALTATAEDVSPGLPFVKTRIILEGKRGHLYVVTSVSGGRGKSPTYQQCVTVETGDQFRATPGRARNPFAAAQQSESDSRSYYLDLDRSRRIVLRTTHEGRELVNMEVKDRAFDTWTNIQVRAWEVADTPSSSDYSLPESCKEPLSVEGPTELGAWELLNVFFPRGLEEETASRRLHLV